MKIASIILGVIAIAFIAVQIFALKSQKNIETYPYVIDKKYDQFEIRRYEVTLFSSVQLSSNTYKKASSEGLNFSRVYFWE